jgi:cell division protein FtsL
MTIGADIAPSTTEGGTGVAGLSKAVSVVSEGQYNAVGESATSFSPATLTAMVGMKKGEALTISPNVTKAMEALQAKADSSDYPANVQAAAALVNLTTLQNNIFSPADQAGFGSIVGQVQGHIETSHNLINTSNFLSNSSYSDFGTGISDLGSMADRGMKNVLGSFSGAGKAIESTGTMFDGISVKNFSSPTGLVQSLQKNKLANATGVNQKLVDAGVDLNDLDNPVYKDQISNVLGGIKDPTAINVTADQMNIKIHSLDCLVIVVMTVVYTTHKMPLVVVQLEHQLRLLYLQQEHQHSELRLPRDSLQHKEPVLQVQHLDLQMLQGSRRCGWHTKS